MVEINPAAGMGMGYQLELTSHGPMDYDHVFVTLLPPNHDIRFLSNQQGVTSTKVDGHNLLIGGLLVRRVELTDGRVPSISLRVKCQVGNDAWTVAVPIKDNIGPTA